MTAENLRSTYLKVPSVKLEEAIRKVPNFTKHMPSCVSAASMSSIPKFGLRKEEVAVIKTYTAECEIYRTLNQALRTEQLKSIEPWFAYLKLFHMAVNKLPSNKASLCRGENGDRSHLYKIGFTVTWVSVLFEKNILFNR